MSRSNADALRNISSAFVTEDMSHADTSALNSVLSLKRPETSVIRLTSQVCMSHVAPVGSTAERQSSTAACSWTAAPYVFAG